jgi:hypothetical protein
VAASLAAQTDAAASQYAVDSATPRAAASPAAGAVAGADYQQQMPRFEPQPQEQTLSGSAAISDSTEDAAAAALSTDDCSLPWDQDPMRLLVAALCRQGARFHAALVHRSVALLEAGNYVDVDVGRHSGTCNALPSGALAWLPAAAMLVLTTASQCKPRPGNSVQLRQMSADSKQASLEPLM